MASRKRDRATVKLSLSPDASDDESASHQLLTEALQSPRSLGNSAARSANLLNAARASKRGTDIHPILSSPPTESSHTLGFSSPRGMAAGKATSGKLKRPSFQSANLAKMAMQGAVKRRNVYDMPISPEKGPVKVGLKENSGVMKKSTAIKSKAKRSELSLDLLVSSPPAEEPVSDNANLEDQPVAPSSPNVVHHDESSGRKSGRLAGEEAAIDGIDWGKRPGARREASPRSKRKPEFLQTELERLQKSPRREKAKPIVGGDDVGEPDQRRTRSKSDKSEPQVVIPVRKTRALTQQRSASRTTLQDEIPQPPVANHTAGEEATIPEADEDVPTTAGHQEDFPEIEIGDPPAKGRGRKRKVERKQTGKALVSKAKTRPTRTTSAAEMDGPEDSEPLFVPDGVVKRGRGRPKKRNLEEANAVAQQIHDEIDPGSDGLQDEGEDGSADDEEQDPREDVNGSEFEEGEPSQTADFEQIFRFVDSSEREGRCRTKDGLKIKKACDKACELISEYDKSWEEVDTASRSVAGMLADMHGLEGLDDRMDFKSDAFAYLFRSLARLFEAVYDWSKQQYGDPLRSIHALRLLVDLMLGIVRFKDTLMSWKDAPVTQRFKGDRIVKNVEQDLIAPLRKAKEKYKQELSRLQQAEAEQRTRQAAREQTRQREAEESRNEEATRVLKARKQRWQDLHVKRSLCEPSIDPQRRRHLRYRATQAFEEVDANGVKFEREPIFRDRLTPFTHRASSFDGQEWTEKQLGALIDGLQEYAGPAVFERIFVKYCKPGGALRDLNVSEITAQAAYLRSKIIDRCQSNGWEVEGWVKQIPVLP